MGKKDIAQHDYFSNPRRFADLWNGLAFKGEQVINWEDLSDLDSTQTYSKNMVMLKKTADLIKKWTSSGQELAILLAENQETIDYSLIVRIMFEQALSYHTQVAEINRRNVDTHSQSRPDIYETSPKEKISAGEYLYRFRKEDRIKPVAAIALYWGTGEWDGSTTLHDMMDFNGIPSDNLEALKYFVPDYAIRVIDMNRISDDDNHFHDSGLKHLVGLMSRRNDKDELLSYAMETAADMDSETQDLAVLMLDSEALKKHYEEINSEGGFKNKMCKAIDDLITDSKNEGIIEGRNAGIIEGRNAGIIEGRNAGIIEGRNAGIIEGRNAGIIETYVGLVNDGEYTFEKAASKNKLTVAEFIAKAESLGYKFKNKPE